MHPRRHVSWPSRLGGLHVFWAAVWGPQGTYDPVSTSPICSTDRAEALPGFVLKGGGGGCPSSSHLSWPSFFLPSSSQHGLLSHHKGWTLSPWPLSSRRHPNLPRSLLQSLLSRARKTLDAQALEDGLMMFLSSIFCSYCFPFYCPDITCRLTGRKTPAYSYSSFSTVLIDLKENNSERLSRSGVLQV